MKSKYLMIAALVSLFALAGCKRPETAPTETPPPASQDTMSPQPETAPPAETPPPEQTPPSDQPQQQPPQQ